MNIYLRKILKHDITHQISVTKEILNGFFGVFEEKESTNMTGKKSGFTGNVTFLLSTDPRFGGEIKQIIQSEGGMQEDDILLFVKSKNGYVLEVIGTKDSRHETFISIMKEERHLIINVDADDANEDDDILNHNVFGIHIKEENDALSNERPHICIGWSGMGDLSDISSREDLGMRYDATWPGTKPRKKGQDTGQIWRFINDAQIGDYVIFADNDIFHIGVIDSDYYYDDTEYPEQNKDYTNNRKVTWLKTNLQKNTLSETFRNSLSAGMSFWTLNDYKSAVAQLLDGSYVKDEFDSFENVDLTFPHISVQDELSVPELGNILSDMYNSSENKTTAIHMFGIKYGEIIRNKYSANEIVRASTIPESYHAEVSKGVRIYEALINNEYGVTFSEKKEVEQTVFDYSSIKGKGINKIFYGTPGCGKSHYIEHDILGKNTTTKEYSGDYKKENIIRTTFYQDYSNTDFVGQILPKIVKGKNGEKDSVEYIFNPGPFTLALIQAISNPTEKVALVVEEINRGNAPAIFGDIFQLLDRDDDCISEYGIVNVGVMDYLNNYTFKVDGEDKKYTFGEIKIPGNMYIYATMNTSDQNVYTLDTAFVRRWGKEKIQNSFTKCKFSSVSVPGMVNYTWEEFVTGINNCIASHLEDLQVNEDKQIGAFFVKENFLKEATAEEFAYKVFDYLWSDVAKLDHGIFFRPFDTLDKLIAAYKSEGVKVFQSGIFTEKFITPQQQINELNQDDDSDE